MTGLTIKIAGATFDAPAIIKESKSDWVNRQLSDPVVFQPYEKKVRESLLKQVYDIAVKITSA